jgi:DNA repair exonuclease SbcCD nuclease subunit
MKLAIISDLHVGKRQYRTDDNKVNRFEKIGYDTLEKNIDIILDRHPDYVIICGDIFETADPSSLALSTFYREFSRLKDIKSLIILGNHDFSFANRRNNCNSLDIVLQSTEHKIVQFADYEVKSHTDGDVLFVLLPYVYDTIDNLNDLWKQCYRLAKDNPTKHRILITHGVTQQYADKHTELKDKYVIPEKVVRAFNEVFIGHIHTPFEYISKDTRVISPGSLIDYQASECHTGPLFYDTDTDTLERVHVDTPYLIKKTLSEKTINKFLKSVGPYIYKILYDGDLSAIDNDLYIEAKNRAVSLTFQLKLEQKDEEQEDTTDIDFFSWLSAHYPTKLEAFKHAREELHTEK